MAASSRGFFAKLNREERSAEIELRVSKRKRKAHSELTLGT